MNDPAARHLVVQDATETSAESPTESPTETSAASPTQAPPAISAFGLRLHGSRGLVYGPLDLDVQAGELVVLQGPQGAGRTSLLLTLAGRMVPDLTGDGWLHVLDHDLPRQRVALQRRAAIAGFAGIDDLDDAVTVADSVRERLTWLAPWYRRTPRVTDAVYRELAGPVFGDREPPALDSMVWDLDEVDALLLRITLALAQRPALLVVDDLDQVHDSARRQLVWTRLEALCAAGLTVVGSVASAGEAGAVRWESLPQVVRLTTGPSV
ncbi:ATP-binding cassette domain-containing protein [Oerskovia flava]|uniref:ATP-binding cassette domain-containing protein n=1 Tax=Oerskovia flava TaxID=2986422 RepID=UPI0022404445|nr:ATP-binding cassette domain-containing protein [Oerskovia sp. JB1-3-2]